MSAVVKISWVGGERRTGLPGGMDHTIITIDSNARPSDSYGGLQMRTNTPTTASTEHTGTEDRRFAELAVRTGLEPGLEARYTADPVAVLAEFGLPAAETPYGGVPDSVAILAELGLCASEPVYAGDPLLIEDLEQLDARDAEQLACFGCTRADAFHLEVPGTVGA